MRTEESVRSGHCRYGTRSKVHELERRCEHIGNVRDPAERDALPIRRPVDVYFANFLGEQLHWNAALGGNKKHLGTFSFPDSCEGDLFSVWRPLWQTRAQGWECQLYFVASVSTAAKQNLVGKRDISNPFSIGRKIEFSGRNAAQQWLELVQLGIVLLQFSSHLLADDVDSLAVGTRSRCKVGERSCGKLKWLTARAIEHSCGLSCRPNFSGTNPENEVLAIVAPFSTTDLRLGKPRE